MIEANGMLRCSVLLAQPRSGWTDRTVKYIANSAAKNISSEDSQTMVPTTDHVGSVGRMRRGARADAVAVATARIITAAPARVATATPR